MPVTSRIMKVAELGSRWTISHLLVDMEVRVSWDQAPVAGTQNTLVLEQPGVRMANQAMRTTAVLKAH